MATVRLEQRGHVGVVTIDRPDALNALSSQVLRDLSDVLDLVELNEEIYVVVLTGAGRSFVAGADIGFMRCFDAVKAKAFSDLGNQLFLRIENFTKPIIAVINGFALGGGCELSMACDIRLASDKAKFGQPEVGLGIPPGFGGTQRLPRLVGSAKAMELILTARVIGAQEAEQIGLVNAVYPADELMAKALSMADTIAAQAQVAVRISKQCIRRGIQADISTAATYEGLAFAMCFDTEDQKEGMGAFLEKRAEKHFINR